MHRSIPALRNIDIRLDGKFTTWYPCVFKKLKTWKTSKLTDKLEQIEFLVDFTRSKYAKYKKRMKKIESKLYPAREKRDKVYENFLFARRVLGDEF